MAESDLVEASLPAPDNVKSAQSTMDVAVLLLTVFVVGLCTIVYELLIGSVSSYFLGDSIKQFSITIGVSMAAMGVGTLVSRYITTQLMRWFVFVEFTLGIIGGLSVPLLFVAYAHTDIYQPIMMVIIAVIGILIGLEIPLLTRIMEGKFSLRSNISNVLSLDYFGAIVATLLFPFFMLPYFGIFNSSAITGCINLAVGCFNLWYFRAHLGLTNFRGLKLIGGLAISLMVGILVFSQGLMNVWESGLYEDRVIHSETTPYQRIVVTKERDDLRLYLNGNLQFSSIDEYRYHEPLAHVPMAVFPRAEKVLILGGGEGLLARELLKHKGIREIIIVDLDPAISALAREHNLVRKVNGDSLNDPRVTVLHEDAYNYLKDNPDYHDLIIADLPDPNNTNLARLYSREFYKLVRKRLSRMGVFVTQATSPFFARDAFWSIHNSVAAAGFHATYPFHALVPSFGDWGFVMAVQTPFYISVLSLPVETRYLKEDMLPSLFVFPKDLEQRDVAISTLNEPEVLGYYLKGWQQWR